MGRHKGPDWKIADIGRALLAWYGTSQRDLPWRRTRDPYAIWVSEIMLQQTRVAVVIERFTQFLERFPTVQALARADEDQVLSLWSGLGYYRRARMLHKAAGTVVAEHGGILPAKSSELRKLPGIGAYTAAAIASIAHNEPVAVVDGNVERVLCRLAGWEFNASEGPTVLRKKIEALANQLVDPQRPGDFNQAMMELGATVCLPRAPRCAACPLVAHCATRGEHATAPRATMKSREVSHALVLRGTPARRQVLLERRSPSQTVMPGMWELPPIANGREPLLSVRHAIMQVNYTVRVCAFTPDEVASLPGSSPARRWVPLAELASLPLTGLARKVLHRTGLLAPAPPPSLPRRTTGRAAKSPRRARA